MENPVLKALDFLKIELPKKPKLASWVTVVDIGDSRLQFRGNDFMFSFQNELLFNAFLDIYDWLDGNHSLETIVNSKSGSFRSTTIEFLLKTLFANGLIFENEFLLEDEKVGWDDFAGQIEFISRFTSTPHVAFQKIRSSNIVIAGSPEIGEELIANLANIGFKKPHFVENVESFDSCMSTNGSLEKVDFLVAASWSLDFKHFKPVNTFCHENGIQFCCVAIEGEKALLGPTVIPFQSPCVVCLESRYFSHDSSIPGQPELAKVVNSANGRKATGRVTPLLPVVCGEAALEITRFLTGIAPPSTIGGVFEFSGYSPMPKRHQILKVPRCRACGTKVPTTIQWDL